MKNYLKSIAVGLALSTAGICSADVLLETNFDGASVSGSQLTGVTWTQDAAMNGKITGATIINGSTNLKNTDGSFVDNIGVDSNLNADPRSTPRAITASFSVASQVSLTKLTIGHGHLSGSGNSQTYTSDMTITITDVTSSPVVKWTNNTNYDYQSAAPWLTTPYELSSPVTLEAGHNYTISVSMQNMVGGGAFAAWNSIKLENVAEAKDDFKVVGYNTTTSIDVLANDSGISPPVTAITQGANGTVAINGNNVDYTPNNDFFGTDTFTYTVGGDTATVSVQVAGTVVAFDSGDTKANLIKNDGTLSGKDALDVTSTTIGSDSSDSNNWGSGATSAVTGDDIGSTWRMAAMAKVHEIIAADGGDALTAIADMTKIKAVTLRLKQSAAGSANTAGYAPRASLYGIDSSKTAVGGWWGTVNTVTQGTTASSTYVDGTYDAVTSEWVFTFKLASEPMASTNDNNIFGITVVGNKDAVADESLSFSEADSTLYITTENILTPAVGLQVIQTGNVLEWRVGEEIDVKEYRVVDTETDEIYEVVLAVAADNYSVTVPEGAKVELVVVDKSGLTKTYAPEDGNDVTEIYNLEQGWNLIAVTSNDADLKTLEDETAGVVWGWSGHSYEVVDSVEVTDGLWVFAPTAKTVRVKGRKSDAKIKLQLGWNLVGPVKDDYIPAEADTVYAWSKVYDIIAGEHKVLIGGKGYWIFSY